MREPNPPETMRAARIHRMEILLLGMALAVDGDREKILESVNVDDLQSELVADCLTAIRTKDPVDVNIMRQTFSRWGMPVGESVLSSLLEAVKAANLKRRVRRAAENLTKSPDEFLPEALDEILDEISTLKEAGV